MTTALRELYGLIGDPVEHSLSPEIQAAALATLARTAAYVPFRVESERLVQALDGARALGIKGLNVTIPHKERVAELVDDLEGDAAAIRAVNVVVQRLGRLVGHNTDTAAVTAALEKAGVDAAGKRALVLGAGGAAKAAAYALGKAGCAEVIVANRTFRRSRDVCHLLSGLGIEALASPLSLGALRELVPMSQIVVNATAVGLRAPDASPLPDGITFDADAIAIDMVYRPLKTRFLIQAREQGVRTIDGLDLLVNQAIASLRLWLGRPVDAARLAPVMRAAALEALL